MEHKDHLRLTSFLHEKSPAVLEHTCLIWQSVVTSINSIDFSASVLPSSLLLPYTAYNHTP